MIQNLKGYTNRDLVLFHKGDTLPMRITDTFARAGWAGGTFVRWVDDGTGQPALDKADGRYCGFFAFGSNETGDQYTAMTGQNPKYKYGILFFGGNFLATITYERYGYLARHSLGPMTPLVYSSQQVLYISENGLITTENESDTTLYPAHSFPNGDPMVPNSFVFFGVCSLPPSAASDNYLFAQTNFGV